MSWLIVTQYSVLATARYNSVLECVPSLYLIQEALDGNICPMLMAGTCYTVTFSDWFLSKARWIVL